MHGKDLDIDGHAWKLDHKGPYALYFHNTC